MAVQTIYLLGTAGSAPNYFGNTQLNGSAPTAANTAFGWTPSRTAISTPYYRGYLGATAASTAALAASYNASASGPTPGTGTGATTAGDSFICGPFFGTFANTAWTFAFNLRASTAGCVGHVNLRVWRSVNASGSNAAQVLANTAGATVTLSATADVNSSVSWSPGTLTLNQEYLFFQVEWQETTVGTTNNDNVFFRVGTAAVTTPDYQMTPATGTLSVTETGDTIAGTASTNLAYGRGGFGVGAYNGPTQGVSAIGGTLAVTQAAQTLSGTGTVAYPTITGTLAVTQASHTIISAGAVTVRGALGVTQANETLAAAGTLPIAGTLGLTQQAQTLSATGGAAVVGTLSAPQAAQTLAASAGPIARGTLSATQAAETLAGSGVVLSGIAGSVNLVQAAQTLSGAGTVTGLVGNLAQTQASETLSATAGVTVRGTLSAPQAAQTLSGTGSVQSVISGTLNRPQAAQTLSAAGTVVYPVIIGRLGAVVGPPYGMGGYGAGPYGNGLLQVAQTLAARATVGPVAGTLNLAQAAQTLSAAATVGPVSGAIAGVLQDDQTLTDGKASVLWAAPAPCEFGVWTPQGMSVGYGVYNFGAGPFGGSAVVNPPLVQGGWLAPANCTNGSWRLAA